MAELFHNCSHLIGCCGEQHPNILTFILGHNEVLQLFKLKFLTKI